MRSKFLLFYVFVLFISQVVLAPQAHAFLRLEQLVKDTRDMQIPSSLPPKYQRLSCEDVTGDIERVTVALVHRQTSPSNNPFTEYTLEFQGAITQVSETLRVTDADGLPHEYTFRFSSPVNAVNLCAGQGSVLMKINFIWSGYLDRGYLLGSASSDAYRDANFDCGYSCAIRDWYFIINPHFSEPPVIALNGNNPFILEEGDVYIEPYASAVDPEDGDVTSGIVIGGDIVDTGIPGVYAATYNVADSSGVSATEVTRQVVVEAMNRILEPVDLQVDSKVNSPNITTPTPTFSAVFYSPTSTALVVAYEIQVSTSSGNWVAPYYDSGMQTFAQSFAPGERSPQILGPTFPQDGRTYFWRIRFWDQDGNKGMWSVAPNYFLVAIPPSSSTHLLGGQYVANDGIFDSKYAGAAPHANLSQKINCLAVQGHISGIELAGYFFNSDVGYGVMVVSDQNGNTSEPYELQTPSGNIPLYTRHVFDFHEPITCVGDQEIIFKISTTGTPGTSAYVDGALSEVYPWGECIGTCNEVKDIYFKLIGTSTIVTPTNHAPILDLIGNRTANEGELIEFAVNATDTDGDVLTYSASNLPAGASFNVSTGLFSWTPSFSQEGNYADIEFTVMDNGEPMELDTELIMISVGNVNRPPVFAAVGNQAALEGETISFLVSATDPDGDSVGIVASGTPAGASFDVNTGLFTWTPTLTQAGAYVVQFIATDNGAPSLASLLEVPLTVGDNPTPTEQAEAVVDIVVDYNFPLNVENSYLANLKKVAKFIEEGKIAAARNQILAFIDKVESDMLAGVIGQAEGDELLALANALLEDLQ